MGERREGMGKLEKVKHNHLLTTLLKNLIFALVMLAPFFAVLSRCMYVTFNKNAYQSYSGTEVTYTKVYDGATNEINSVNDIVLGNYYKIQLTDGSDTFNEYCLEVELDNVVFYNTYIENGYVDESTLNTGTDASILNNFRVSLQLDGDDEYSTILYGSTDNVSFDDYIWLLVTFNIDTDSFIICQILSFDYAYNELVPSLVSICPQEYMPYHFEQKEISNLDNAFEYSVNQLNDMQIFNWTNNTAIYTPINSMCSGLGFTQNDNVIALLLTYWAINTAIYIIFDIVIACFTKLTHFMASE